MTIYLMCICVIYMIKNILTMYFNVIQESNYGAAESVL